MPSCFVPFCQSGSSWQRKYYEDNNLPKIHFFRVKNEETRKKWQILIKRGDKPMGANDRVCSAHFPTGDIILNDEVVINGKVEKIPRERAALKPEALPTLFQNNPPCYQYNAKKRKAPTSKSDYTPSSRKRNRRKQSKPPNEEIVTVPDSTIETENAIQYEAVSTDQGNEQDIETEALP